MFFHSLKIYKFVYVNRSASVVQQHSTALPLHGTELLILHDCDVCKIANE